MLYKYTMEYYSSLRRNEVHSDTYDIDESWKHYGMWNILDTKEKIFYHSTYMKYLE